MSAALLCQPYEQKEARGLGLVEAMLHRVLASLSDIRHTVGRNEENNIGRQSTHWMIIALRHITLSTTKDSELNVEQ